MVTNNNKGNNWKVSSIPQVPGTMPKKVANSQIRIESQAISISSFNSFSPFKHTSVYKSNMNLLIYNKDNYFFF